MLGMQGRSLIQEESISWGATKPVGSKYWSHTPETASTNCWAPRTGACAPQQEQPLQPEAHTQQGDPAQPKIHLKKKTFGIWTQKI